MDCRAPLKNSLEIWAPCLNIIIKNKFKKTELNNCFIIYLKNLKQTEEAICILFVLRKKQSLSPSAAVVISIAGEF